MHQLNGSTPARRSLAVVAAMALAATAALAPSASAHSQRDTSVPRSTFTVGVNKATGGSTTVTLDTGLVATLAGLGVTAAAAGPATSPTAGVVSFPIIGGSVVYVQRQGRQATVEKVVAGWLTHSGGLTLSKGLAKASLTDLRINLSAGRDGAISGRINGAKREVQLFRMVAPKLNSTDRSLSASLTLGAQAAAALNAAFSTTSLTATTPVGKVVIAPTFS